MSTEPILVTSESPSQDLGSRGMPRPTFAENAEDSPPAPSTCEACGAHHGSVNQELVCLRLELRRKRKVIEWYEERGEGALVVRSETRVSDPLVQSPHDAREPAPDAPGSPRA